MNAVAVAIVLGGVSANAAQILTHINPWQKAGCIPELIKDNDHYICARNGSILCLPGWIADHYGDLCSTPVCNPECVHHQGNCTAPNTCTCELGWFGPDCARCVCLPGCVNGTCTKPFECRCREGYTGLYCDKPICREGCVHGTCKDPGECTCHPGWTGPECSECIPLPDCLNGFCEKPLECRCRPGYEGQFCHKAICRDGCDKDNGFCMEPGECWCRPGNTGPTCTECLPYPGCANGFCEKPWECICEPGFGGKLCNNPLNSQRPAASQLQQFRPNRVGRESSLAETAETTRLAEHQRHDDDHEAELIREARALMAATGRGRLH